MTDDRCYCCFICDWVYSQITHLMGYSTLFTVTNPQKRTCPIVCKTPDRVFFSMNIETDVSKIDALQITMRSWVYYYKKPQHLEILIGDGTNKLTVCLDPALNVMSIQIYGCPYYTMHPAEITFKVWSQSPLLGTETCQVSYSTFMNCMYPIENLVKNQPLQSNYSLY
jgi:hypothetical protein